MFRLIFIAIVAVLAACSTIPSEKTDEQSSPNPNKADKVALRVTCLGKEYLCERLKQKGFKRVSIPNVYPDSYYGDIDGQILRNLANIKLCGTRATTYDIALAYTDREQMTYQCLYLSCVTRKKS